MDINSFNMVKKQLFIFLITHLSFNSICQDITNTNSVKYDYTHYKKLKGDGVPKLAFEELKRLKEKAILEKNIGEFWTIANELKNALQRSYFENEELEKEIWNLANESEKISFPLNNILHYYVAEIIQNHKYYSVFNYDDESLTWIFDGKQQKLTNNNLTNLINYHKNMSIDKRIELQKFSIQEYDVSENKNGLYYPTLFDYFVTKYIEDNKYTINKLIILEPNLFERTEVLSQSKLINDSNYKLIKLYSELETLNLKNKNWLAYANHVKSRLNFLQLISYHYFDNTNGFEQLYNTAIYEFEFFLADKPEKYIFTEEIIKHKISKTYNYHWKTNTTSKFEKYEATKILEKYLKDFPNSIFKKDCVNQLNELKKIYYFSSISINPNINENGLLRINYNNISKLSYAILKVESNKQNNTNSEKIKNQNLKLIYQDDVILENDSLLLNHSKDIILPKINEYGQHYLILAENKDSIHKYLSSQLKNYIPNSTCTFYVNSIKLLSKKTENGSEFLILDKVSGKPIKSKIDIYKKETPYSEEEKYFKTIYCDKNGRANLKGDNQNYSLHILYGKDSLLSNFYQSFNENTPSNEYKIFTDRSIYRPGQTIQYKIIGMFNHDTIHKVLAGEKIEISISGNNFELHNSNVELNEFGSYSGSFVIPQNSNSIGDLYIDINNIYNYFAKVEEYKRPTFEVKIDDNIAVKNEKDTLFITGNVKAYAGYPVTNAKVNLNIREHRYYYQKRYIPQNHTKEIDTFFTVISDEKGNFKGYILPFQLKNIIGSNLNISAEVTDVTGETQRDQESIYIGKKSKTLNINASNEYFSNKKNELQIEVKDMDGMKIPHQNLEVQISKITTENWKENQINEAEYKNFDQNTFAKIFPSYNYYSTSKEKIDLLSSKIINIDNLLELNTLINELSGEFIVHVQYIDENKDTLVQKAYFNWINTKSKKFDQAQPFSVFCPKKEVKVGDKIEIYLYSGLKKLNVHQTIDRAFEKNEEKFIKVKGCKKIEYIVQPKDKKGLAFCFYSSHNNNIYDAILNFSIIDTTKNYHIKLDVAKDHLKPGNKEKWTVTIENQNKNVSNLELLASMYDASLDAIYSRDWETTFYNESFYGRNWEEHSYEERISYRPLANIYGEDSVMEFSEHISVGRGEGHGASSGFQAPKMTMKFKEPTLIDENIIVNKITPRSNFNETAFYYPSVSANNKGEYQFEFTLPDALTQWKLRTLAHDKNLNSAYFEKTFTAKKELMVEANEPRFFREKDAFVFSSKVINLTDKEQKVKVKLELLDVLNGNELSSQFGVLEEHTLTIQANASNETSWTLKIPEHLVSLVNYKITAYNESFSDAEIKPIPILSNKQQITETMRFVKTSSGEEKYAFDKINLSLPSTEKLALTIQVQTQPLWTTLMSLPYLMEYPHECAEQTFSRYFGNVIAQKIIKENPKFREIINAWKQTEPNVFLSELEKNPDLKNTILTETPWILDAQNESIRKQHLFELFDDNNLTYNIQKAYDKLNSMSNNGAWAWFGNNEPNIYITQHIISGFGLLKEMNIEVDEEMIDLAFTYLDSQFEEAFNKLKPEQKTKLEGLNNLTIQWLNARAYFTEKQTEASTYYLKCIERNWKEFDIQLQAMMGLSAIKSGNKTFAEKLKNSLLDRSVVKPNLGRYWKETENNYYWYNSSVETQSMLIQFFNSFNGMEKEIQQMQLWLLNHKQLNSWETTKETTLACYALICNKNVVNKQINQEVSIRFNDYENPTKLNAIVGTLNYNGSNAINGKSNLYVSTTTDYPVFGAMYYSYLEEMSNITKSSGDFKLERHYYIKNDKGIEQEINADANISVGTKITVKVTLKNSMPMEYVHLKDLKASGFESTNQLSGYTYQNGFSSFKVNRDASMNFFVDYLPKGTHTFEYEVYATCKGEFSIGASQVECMYQPSYKANSNGFKVVVD